MVTIPSTVFGLMGLIITTLCGVILWQQKRIDKGWDRLDSKQVEKEQLLRETLQSYNTFSVTMGEALTVLKEVGRK